MQIMIMATFACCMACMYVHELRTHGHDKLLRKRVLKGQSETQKQEMLIPYFYCIHFKYDYLKPYPLSEVTWESKLNHPNYILFTYYTVKSRAFIL